jgi:uncharacterized membrane protein
MRLLDILIATLIAWPLLTGGFSIEMDDYFFELADFGIVLLFGALLAEALRRWPRPWQRGHLAREAAGLAVVAGLAGLALAVLFLFALLGRYLGLEGQSFDIGTLFTRAVWNLTHGTGATLLVALIAAAVRRRSNEPWEASFFVRLARTLAQAWLRMLERSPRLALWGAAAVVGTQFFWVALLRHWAFESHGHDLGIYTNAIWNLTHGNGYVSAIKDGQNLFLDHQAPSYWLFAPIFWLVPRPETLLFLQSFGLAAGGPALYYLGRGHFGRESWAPAALPWLYWCYLPLRNANAFDFHPEFMMWPLFLWAFVAFASERGWKKALGVVALLAALGAKESAPVVAVGIGVAWALTREGSLRARWPGIALAVAGVALFFFDVKVMPRLFGGDYAYMSFYERFGGGIGDLLLAPFTQPRYFFSQLITPERLSFLFWTLAPLGFLPLFHWRAAVAALPPYMVILLSEGDQRVRIVFHYGIEPGSALFWALPFGLAAFARRFGWRFTGIWMLVWAVAAFGTGEIARMQSFIRFPHAGWIAKEVMPCLNRDAPIAASGSLVPHMSTRFWAAYPDQLRQKPSGEPVRCVVTDLKLENWPLGRQKLMRVLEGLPEHGYREVWRCYDFRVHELEGSGCLSCVPKCVPVPLRRGS